MKLISLLEARLRNPLPGKAAQYKMATQTRRPHQEQAIPKDARLANVLCLLYPKNGKWHIPLIQRVITEKDKHSGQISFPGGKMEPTDNSRQAGALRETNEEIGVPVSDISILGGLSSLYIPASNFQVYPFIGFMNYAPTFIPQESEVAEVVEVELEQLIHPATLKYKSITFRNNFNIKNVPYFDVNNKTVWGATAMMLSEFVEIVKQIEN